MPVLFTTPLEQFLDNNGAVANGALLYVYAPGTTTPKDSYTTSAGTTANANPVVLNSAGRPATGIYLNPGDSYRFVLKDSTATTTYFDQDYLLAPPDLGYATDSGSVNAIAAAPTNKVVSYVAGQSIDIKVSNANTATAVTVALSGLAAKTVLLPDGSAPPVGFIQASVYRFVYDGTNFILSQSRADPRTPVEYVVGAGTANAGTATPAKAWASYAAGNMILVKPTADNTGAVTFNISGLGVVAVTTLTGAALAGGELDSTGYHLLVGNGSALTLLNPALAPGVTAVGGLTVSPRLVHTGGNPPKVSTDGSDQVPVITEVYICEMYVPCRMTVTGGAVMNGSVVSGNIKVGLADSTGAVVATSASTAQAGTDAYQRVPFTATVTLNGPATYYLLTFIDNITGKFNAHTFGNFGASKQTGQTYATGFTTITPPTTFTTALGTIASLY